MSLKNWGSKISAPKEEVLLCLKQLAVTMNGKFDACEESAETGQDNICVMITSIENDDGSTAIGWYESGLVPDVMLHLSKALGTKVVSVDQQENVGYQHFSELNAGAVVRLFSRCDVADPPIRDYVNIPDEYLIDIARRKESKGFLARVEKDPSQYAFDLLLAEHDMQLFPIEELFEAQDLEYYEILVKGLGKRFLGSIESAENQVGRYWSDLVNRE